MDTLYPRRVKADKRAIAMGCDDKTVNNVDPTYRGKVEINGETLDVISSAVFGGTLHWGLSDYKEAVTGWIPAYLCNIPDVK